VLGQAYVEKYFPPEAKRRMLLLVENLRVRPIPQIKQALIDELKKNPIQGSTILVKASRGIGLEAILDFL